MQADYSLKRDKLSLDLFWIGSRARAIHQDRGAVNEAQLSRTDGCESF